MAEKAERKPLQMIEQGRAQVIDHRLPHPGHDVDPEVGADPLDERYRQIGKDGVQQHIVIAGGQAAVDGDLDEIGSRDRRRGGAEHEQHREEEFPGVGPGVGEQPAGDLRVVALVVLLLRLGDVCGRV